MTSVLCGGWKLFFLFLRLLLFRPPSWRQSVKDAIGREVQDVFRGKVVAVVDQQCSSVFHSFARRRRNQTDTTRMSSRTSSESGVDAKSPLAARRWREILLLAPGMQKTLESSVGPRSDGQWCCVNHEQQICAIIGLKTHSGEGPVS